MLQIKFGSIGQRLTTALALAAILTAMLGGLLWVSAERQEQYLTRLADRDLVLQKSLIDLRTSVENYNGRLMGVLADIYAPAGTVEPADKLVAAMRKNWDDLRAVPDSHVDLAPLDAAMRDLGPIHAKVVAALKDRKFATATYEQWIDVHAALRRETQRALDQVEANLREQVMAEAGWSSAMAQGAMAAAAAAIVIVLFGAWMVSRTISRPLSQLIHTMQVLARGDMGVVIPAERRADEIGEMASAVQVFKDNMIKADQLAEEQRKTQEAQIARGKRIEDLCTRFDATSSEAVKSVAAAASEMQSSSEAMSATAEETTRQSAAVAAASEQASANVETVASAAEELSSSIGEISRQVTQASQIASSAVKEAEQTNVKVQGLAQAANKIGEVVALITDIAEQTNLLALNATIEAARAGDAGKGFAVVASEVKNLANQTAKATDEIGAQISGIQAATREAVSAIESITKTITQINEVNSGVASAVEEQGAATQEIARNVEQAAAGTQEVSSNIGGVSQAANDTGAAALQIQSTAGELSQQAERLRAEVDKFLTNVRAA